MLEDTTLAASLAALPATKERGSLFQTFSTWAMACHGLLALGLWMDAGWARHWLLPTSHLLAWAVFVGAHVLVGFYPETMHRPRIAGHSKLEGKCLTILLGHEVLHVAPVVALTLAPGLWPAHGALSPVDWLVGSLPGLALGAAYFAWQYGDDNAYAASKANFARMFAAAVGAGLLANAAALWRL